MQRVVRSTLVGLLTVAGLTACGDKVTVPPQQTTPPDNVVHGVTVSPASVTLAPGQKATLAASVDAGAGVTVRTVTWSSSNTAVATVAATGEVTAVAAGSATIVAASAAPGFENVKGAAAVTVTGGAGAATVSIQSTNTTVCSALGGCNSVPANLQNFGTASPTGGTGQLDVIANVEANGAALKSVQGTLSCGGKTLTASQNLSGAALSSEAEGNAAPILLSFNTVDFDAASGTPKLFNTGAFNVGSPNTVAPCTLSVSLTPVSGSAPPASSTSIQLNNADVVVMTTTNANGASASDLNGVPWKSGDLKVTAQPILYTQRGVQSITATVPGVTARTITTTATTPQDFIWPNDGNASNNVSQTTLSAGVDANGVAQPVAPTVRIIDSKGNDVTLGLAPTVPATQVQILLDNQSPQPPQTFQAVQTQGQWVNAAYTFFTSVSGNTPSAANMKYVSCGDAPPTAIAAIPAANNPQPDCVAQGGVSAAPANLFSLTNGVNGGANPRAGPSGGPILRVFAFDASAATPPGALTAGTSTSTTTCSALTDPSKGWIEITTDASPLTEGPTNTRYVVRALEVDRLGNMRCTDLATADNTINTTGGLFVRATVGSDKTAPTVPNGRLQNTSENAAAANDQGIFNALTPNLAFIFAASDNLSGFSATPVQHTLRRLNAAATAACVIGSGSSCSPASAALSAAGVPVDNGTGTDGYYTYTASVRDLATNVTSLPARTVLVDKTAPVMGGIQVPATIAGAQNVNFATNATDNLDLLSSDYTLRYPITPTGGAQPLNVRATGPTFGAAFDNTLELNRSFSFTVPFFVRTIATTAAGGAPQNNGLRPDQITGRVNDAAGNPSAGSIAAITANNIPLTGTGVTPQTNYTALQANGAAFNTFQVTNAPTNISNCPTAGCAGGAAAANATSVTLTAAAVGTEAAGPPAFQFLNPFTAGVSFYYLDPATNEWILIGTATAPVVTDNVGATLRTFTWSLSWDPPASLGSGAAANIVAIGVNAAGDGLASENNANITLTNP